MPGPSWRERKREKEENRRVLPLESEMELDKFVRGPFMVIVTNVS